MSCALPVPAVCPSGFAAVFRVVAAAAVAGGDVQVAVDGAEADPAAVVIGLRLNESQDLSLRGETGNVGIRGDRDIRECALRTATSRRATYRRRCRS